MEERGFSSRRVNWSGLLSISVKQVYAGLLTALYPVLSFHLYSQFPEVDFSTILYTEKMCRQIPFRNAIIGTSGK